MLLVYALVKAPAIGWTSATSITCFVIAAVLMAIFIVNETRVKHPLVPLAIFKNRNLTGANIIQLCTAAGLFSVFFFCTLYFQEILGFSPVRTGVGFLVVPVVIALSATNVPRLIKKVGARPVLIVAPLISAAGLFILAHVPVSGGYFAHIMPGLIIMGVGLGSTFVSILITATSGVAGHLSGLASGLVNTSQQIGGSLGLAVLTGIVTSSTVRYITNLHARPTTHDFAAASVHGFHVGFYAACIFSLFASLIAVVVIKNKKPAKNSEAAVAL
jgi:predicted MFS family arabinose efflux permease